MAKDLQLQVNQTKSKQATFGKLIIGIILDLLGMATYSIPVLGEFFDILWAPISAFAMFILYRNSVGKIAGVISFIEEALPGLDFIPTFTLTWFYEYYLDKKRGNM